MFHWIARMNLLDSKIKLLEKVDSELEAWNKIHETYRLQDSNNKKNHERQVQRNIVLSKLPVYNKQIHGNIKNFIFVKSLAFIALSKEDKNILAIKHIPRIVPCNHKLVYVSVHDTKGY